MPASRRRTGSALVAVVIAAAAVAAVVITRGGPVAEGPVGQPATAPVPQRGGTLDYLVDGTVAHLDPQRIYTPRDAAALGRTVYRSLVAFPAGADTDAAATTPVPDLATDTGTSSDDARVWSFTLKPGVTWQDGSAITCADLRYGVSRSFATDVITGGPAYVLSYLDVAHSPKTGAPLYDGPYKRDHQADFDRAVTCSADDRTITYRFRRPWPDFPLAIAALPAFDPYRASQDQGPKSDFHVFSDGPYELAGTWDQDRGGVLVRNPHWDATTDTIRQANPGRIRFELGYNPATGKLVKTLIHDRDPDAMTASSVPTVLLSSVTGAVAARAVDVDSSSTGFLVPNLHRLGNLKVRRALAVATDRRAYSRALGGADVSIPAQSIVDPLVPGYVADPVYSAHGAPDIARANALLAASGVKLPYPITLTYPLGTEESNAAFLALKRAWDAAGFAVTLDGLDPSISGPAIVDPYANSDLSWATWASDWPSIHTVLPPLFGSREDPTFSPYLDEDIGHLADATVNRQFDRAAAQTDATIADAQWAAIDHELAAQVDYIPLDVSRAEFLRGSNVARETLTAATDNYPDLATISLVSPGR